MVIISHVFANDIIKNIWNDRYRKNGETYDESLRRVAHCVASVEDSSVRNEWEQKFYQVMDDELFFPAGRTMSNAGIGDKLTLNNCFIAPMVGDDMESIFDSVKLGALTHKAGGGIGYSFSLISPRGKHTHNDAIASGPVSFMDVFDAQTATIQQGSRRGANMGILSVYHPDIFEFVTAKAQDANRLKHFNLSVIVDDDFMYAVENNREIELHWPIYDRRGNKLPRSEWDAQFTKTIMARDLWDEIMKMAYNNGEPGVFFEDTLQRMNPANYIENIVASNPCFAGDMKLLTSEGYKRFDELVGRDDISVVSYDGQVSTGNKVWCSGIKDTLIITLSNGKKIQCTPNHTFMLCNGESIEANDLKLKDTLAPSVYVKNHYDTKFVKLGFIQGDGELTRLNSKHHHGLSVNFGVNDGDIVDLFSDEKIMSDGYVVGLNDELRQLEFSSMPLPQRVMPGTYNSWSDDQKLAFLCGMFSANGCVVSGHRVQYKTTCRELSNQIKDALSYFGIHCNITTNKAKEVKFSNGSYMCRESYDICINQYDSIIVFANTIGFYHKYKIEALKDLIKEKAPHVRSIQKGDKIPVYDFTENINHWGIVNGVVAHNCSEYLAGTIKKDDCNPEDFGGACNLGSLYLHNFVVNPFAADAYLDVQRFKDAIKIAVRMLDNIIDVNVFPNRIYKNYQSNMRTIGLGVTGLADMLAMLGYKYNSAAARSYVGDLMHTLTNIAYEASVDLGIERGAFPFCDKKQHANSYFVNHCLELNVREKIAKHGIRNAKILAIAPTGTTSMAYGNNCSSGIEPIFQLDYERKIKVGGQDDSNIQIVNMTDYAYKKWLDMGAPDAYRDVWVTALDMSVDDHVAMLSTIVPYVDMSVSKTINIPTEYPFEDTKDVYVQCWKNGVKGCTIFRPNELRQGILIANSNNNAKKTPSKEDSQYVSADHLPRGMIIGVDDDLMSIKKTIFNGCGKFYLHVDFDEENLEFLETYIDIGSGGGCERNLQFISRLMSLALRAGVPLEAIIDQARSIRPCKAYSDRTKKYGDTSPGTSCPSAIGKALEEMLKKARYLYGNSDDLEQNEPVLTEQEKKTIQSKVPVIAEGDAFKNMPKCPECGNPLRVEGGCDFCDSCGFTHCG